MKIDSSVIGMESARVYRSQVRTTRRFVIQEDQEQQKENEKREWKKRSPHGDVTWNLGGWRSGFEIHRGKLMPDREEDTAQELHQAMIKWILELLFHGRVKRWELEKRQSAVHGQETEAFTTATGISADGRQVSVQETDFWEEEHTGFSCSGVVRTQDGREITFGVDLAFSRSFEAKFSKEIQAAMPKLCDPLVINFDTDAANISQEKIFFDLDQDGQEEEICGLEKGCGFLALDRNKDGRINDGSELFGTKSGDGFGDLALYDQDGNGWIDENDEIWNSLKIWTRDGQGKEELYTLAQKGVGAICLGSVGTDFTLLDAEGRMGAVTRRSGIFLFENGHAGTVQHLDLTIYEQAEENIKKII